MLNSTACAEDSALTTEVSAYAAFEAEYTDRDIDPSYDESAANIMNLSGGGQINISKGGVYVLTGVLNGGSIVVDAPDTEKIQLVLRNAEISASDGPAIYAKQCDKLFITLEGTNSISDSSIYTLAEGEDEPDAAIFTKNDVTFNGSGSLSVTGNYKHGIASKDDVKITGGAITINSVEDGLKGRDSVLIKDGTLNITAGTDGIQSNNDSGEDKGRISVDGGSVTIVCGNDGIQAESVLQVNGGVIDIKSGDEANTEIETENGFGGIPGGMPMGTLPGMTDGEVPVGTPPAMPEGGMPGGRGGRGGMRPGGEMPDGTMPPITEGEMPEGGMPGGRGGMRPGGELPDGAMPPMTEDERPQENASEVSGDAAVDETDSVSIKGLKSANALYINGGEITVSAQDDAVHSDVAVTVNGGKLAIRTADDAIHAEYNCVVNDGDISIMRCREGLEGKEVIVNGGKLDITAADDGINASDPLASGSMPGRGDDSVFIEINGGMLKVKSDFDSLDSNGNIFINDGTITLDGPSNGMDCAIDCDGKAYVNGGTVGVSGMSGGSPGFDSESEQGSITVIFTSNQAEDTTAAIYDSKGNLITSVTPSRTYGGVVFSSPKIKTGKTYTVKTNSVSVEVELSEISAVVNDLGEKVNSGIQMGGQMPGGRGARR